MKIVQVPRYQCETCFYREHSREDSIFTCNICSKEICNCCAMHIHSTDLLKYVCYDCYKRHQKKEACKTRTSHEYKFQFS